MLTLQQLTIEQNTAYNRNQERKNLAILNADLTVLEPCRSQQLLTSLRINNNSTRTIGERIQCCQGVISAGNKGRSWWVKA